VIEHLEVIYCAGWDPKSRAVVRPLPGNVARERDVEGESYSVLLLDGGEPVALLDVAWGHHVCVMWRFDRERRRTAKYDFRKLDDQRLLLIEQAEWHYTDLQSEFDGGAPRRTLRYRADGTLREVLEPSGNSGGIQQSIGKMPIESLPWYAVPRFGDWAQLASIPGTISETASFTVRDTLPAGLAKSSITTTPWQPPQALQPGPLEALFRAGSPCSLPGGTPAVIEVHEIGQLQMPTGRLLVGDPSSLDKTSTPYTAAVAAGTYPVTLSIARPVNQPDVPMAVAARLLVSAQEVIAWEMALRPGEDPRVLGDGEFFGFGVDSGIACFVDAAALDAVAHLATQDRRPFEQVRGDHTMTMPIPSAHANLIAFASGMGDGTYPTWIGLAANGQVSSFVADLIVVDNAALLAPDGLD
jgi:hypothetical protein